MAKSKTKLRLANHRFNKSVKMNPQGSVFLGYLYTEAVLEGVIDGSDFRMGLPDLQVRLTRQGEPRIEFPQDLKEVRGESKWVPRYFASNSQTRELLTNAIFELPEVIRAVEEADEMIGNAWREA